MGKTALITGASGGIGYELARIFAEEGYNLVLVARNRLKLDELAREWEARFNISVKAIAKDLFSPRSPSEILIELQQESIPVDILVNNAGVGMHGFFSETDLASELDMIELNIVSLTHLTKLFLKGMLERGEGRILNVASTAAFQPGPLMAVYYATKAYVLYFSEALAEELRGTGVTVTCLCPGPTTSDFQRRANIGPEVLLTKGRLMDARKVARLGYEGMMRNKRVVIPGLLNRILVLMAKWMPRPLVTRAVKILQRSRNKLISLFVLLALSLPLSYAQTEEVLVIDDFNDGNLQDKLGGTWEVWLRTQDDPTQNCKMSFVTEDALGNPSGQAVRLDYDVESENPAYNGFRAYLKDFDATPYKSLSLYLKGDPAPGLTQKVKIELIGPDKRPSPYVIDGITGEWQKFTVPLSEFWVVQDWTKLYQFVVVFADILNTPKTGTVYVDEVSFSKE